jgi:hypothetical protein
VNPRSSELLKEIKSLNAEMPMSIGEILTKLRHRGPLLMMFLFLLPFMQPIPLPGLSTVISVVLVIQVWCFMTERPPWMFKRWQDQMLTHEKFALFEKGADRIIPIIMSFVKKRGEKYFSSKSLRYLSGIIMMIQTLFLSLPLPIPFSNVIPALALMALVIAHIEHDGWLLFVSYFYSSVIFAVIGFGIVFFT